MLPVIRRKENNVALKLFMVKTFLNAGQFNYKTIYDECWKVFKLLFFEIIIALVNQKIIYYLQAISSRIFNQTTNFFFDTLFTKYK